MARRILSAALLLPVLLPAVPARGGPAADLSVLEASVRFRAEPPAAGGAAPPVVRGTLRVKGDFVGGAWLASFVPGRDLLRITLGTTTLLDGVAPPASEQVRSLGDRGWVLRVRKAFDGRGSLTLRMNPASGVFRLVARGFDAGALLGAGPAAVPLRFGIGAEEPGESVDFTEDSPRHWTYRIVPTPRPPPGGGGGGGGGGDPGPVNATTLAQGTDSSIGTSRFEVIADQASWDRIWLEHGGQGSPPPVDFSTDMVVGVWLGSRPTGGYSVHIEAIVVAQILGAPGVGPGIVAVVREDQPGPNCPVTQAVTSPFHIVRTPRVVGGGALAEYSTRVVSCP